ncbi:hypothetical protein OGATHE_000484 [Ogataea polymorpha]|uniref:Uncharacterized protein n=1 Tax=Ogataea polymorpha TaxID=460523 RepID=A0A9P8PUF6_9ASCO|nr:hypothetical protein OGATHE_000484 [Ogataea polymorpha]
MGDTEIRVNLVRVEDVPGSAGGRLVVGERVLDRLEGGFFRVERVAVHVFGRAKWVRRRFGVAGSSRVAITVNSRVNPQGEEVLVVVSVHVRVHSRSPWTSLLVVAQNVRVQNTGESDVESDGSVLHKHPVQTVLVIGSSKYLRHDQLGGSRDERGGKVVSEVRVLEKQPVVLLRVRHVAGTILANVQSVFSLVRKLWRAVRNNHLGQGDSVEDRSHIAVVVVRHVRQNNTFSVVETDVEFEVGPFHDIARHLERNSLWLGHIDRRRLWSHSTNLLDHVFRIEVGMFVLGHFSSSVWDVDENHLLLLRVDDRTEVERVRVLRVVLVGSVVHKSLLQSLARSPSFVVANGPWIAVNLVHLVSRDSRQNTLLDDRRVISDDFLGGTQVLDGQNGLDSLQSSGLDDRQGGQVNKTLFHAGLAGLQNHVVRKSRRQRATLLLPLDVGLSGRFPQSDGVEADFFTGKVALDGVGGSLDLGGGQRVQRVCWPGWGGRGSGGLGGNLAQSFHAVRYEGQERSLRAYIVRGVNFH